MTKSASLIEKSLHLIRPFFWLLSLSFVASPALAKSVLKDGESKSKYTDPLFGEAVAQTSFRSADHELLGLITNDEKTRLIPDEYDDMIVLDTRVFVKKEHDALWSEIQITHSGDGWKVGKPIATPYDRFGMVMPFDDFLNNEANHGLYSGRYAKVADADIATYDLFGSDGQLRKTLRRLHSAPNGFMSGTLLISFIDPEGQPTYGITDLYGNLVGPLIANFRLFQVGGATLTAIPLDDNYFLPLTPKGTFPIETHHVKGYRLLDGSDDVLPYSGFAHNARLGFWVKEYDTEKGSELGLASPSLTSETGPQWKSFKVEQVPVPLAYQNQLGTQRSIVVGEKLDGSWMAYEAQGEMQTDGFWAANLMPVLDAPVADHASLSPAMNALFAQEDKDATKRREIYMADLNKKLAERRVVEERESATFEAAMSANDLDSAREAALDLGGDYYVRYMVASSRTGRYLIPPELMFNLASDAKSSEVAELARNRYSEMLREEAQQAEGKRLAEIAERKAEDEKRKREAAQTPRNTTAWVPNNNTAPAETGWVARQQIVNQYFHDLDHFIYSNSTYLPDKPSWMY